jgi:hypothetical protein
MFGWRSSARCASSLHCSRRSPRGETIRKHCGNDSTAQTGSARLKCLHIAESAPVEAVEVALGSYSRLLDREVLARRPMHAGEHA